MLQFVVIFQSASERSIGSKKKKKKKKKNYLGKAYSKKWRHAEGGSVTKNHWNLFLKYIGIFLFKIAWIYGGKKVWCTLFQNSDTMVSKFIKNRKLFSSGKIQHANVIFFLSKRQQQKHNNTFYHLLNDTPNQKQ